MKFSFGARAATVAALHRRQIDRWMDGWEKDEKEEGVDRYVCIYIYRCIVAPVMHQTTSLSNGTKLSFKQRVSCLKIFEGFWLTIVCTYKYKIPWEKRLGGICPVSFLQKKMKRKKVSSQYDRDFRIFVDLFANQDLSIRLCTKNENVGGNWWTKGNLKKLFENYLETMMMMTKKKKKKKVKKKKIYKKKLIFGDSLFSVVF